MHSQYWAKIGRKQQIFRNYYSFTFKLGPKPTTNEFHQFVLCSVCWVWFRHVLQPSFLLTADKYFLQVYTSGTTGLANDVPLTEIKFCEITRACFNNVTNQNVLRNRSQNGKFSTNNQMTNIQSRTVTSPSGLAAAADVGLSTPVHLCQLSALTAVNIRLRGGFRHNPSRMPSGKHGISLTLSI